MILENELLKHTPMKMPFAAVKLSNQP